MPEFPNFDPLRVYSCDKASASVCSRMSITGFHFDVVLAKKMSTYLQDLEVAARSRVEDAVGRKLKATKSGGISTIDLHRAVFGELGAHVFFRSEKTGNPSLGVDAMRGYAACGNERLRNFAVAELTRRRMRKIRVTNIEKMILLVDERGRIHPTWQNYGTVSGRFSCQAPNLQNLPTKRTDPCCSKDAPQEFRGGVRSLFCAKPGFLLVAYDKKQLEMRIAAYVSGDLNMIAACESKDLHAGNAKVIFGNAFDAEVYSRLAPHEKSLSPADAETFRVLYGMRNLAKSAGFAVCYLAEEGTVYARIVAAGETGVKLAAVGAMLRKLRGAFSTYFEFQNEILLTAISSAYVQSPILGRRRWLSYDPSPTECANFPIQGGAADVMNFELPKVEHALDSTFSDAHIVAQVHDSVVAEVREKDAEKVMQRFTEISESPVEIATSGVRYSPIFPIDIGVSERWH